MKIRIDVFPPDADPPCPGAVKHYGGWRRMSEKIREEYQWGDKIGSTLSFRGAYLLKQIMDTPDSDVKRNAKVEGNYLIWDARDRWLDVEVDSLEQLVELLKYGGHFEVGDGPCIVYDL